jgi:hypothetical protein
MSCTPLSEQDFQIKLDKLISRIVPHFMALFDSWLPICGPSARDDDTLYHNPEFRYPEVKAAVQNGVLSLFYEDECFHGSLAAIDILLSQIWSLSRFGKPFRRFNHEYGRIYPLGKEMISQTIRVGGRDLMQLANTLFTNGYTDDARIMATWLQYYSTKQDSIEDLISGFSPQVFSTLPPLPPITKASTYLARAKQIIATNLLSDTDLIVRLQSYLELYGLWHETNKEKEFIKRVTPALIKQLSDEQNPSLRDLSITHKYHGNLRPYPSNGASHAIN